MKQSIPFILGLLLFSGSLLQAQDITPYTLRSGEEDIFQREVNSAIAQASLDERLPKLGCTVEYLRRLDGEDIVYRRGPIDMHLHGAMGAISTASKHQVGTRPVSPDDAATSYFTGGILVDLPRPGESGEELAMLPEGYRYMLRVALIPQRYVDGRLNATIFLERAVVRETGNRLELHSSEVFSRSVELDGNLPLKFDLPSWDSTLPGGEPAVPERLREGVLITLETPHQFSLPGSYPQPFNDRAQLTYAVPRTSMVRLTIHVQGEERVLDEGQRKPGTYDVIWDAEDLPDDSYTATLVARDDEGTTLYNSEHTLIKSREADSWKPESITMLRRDGSHNFVLSTESGIAYQFPQDNARGLRNMFTHVVFRLGYRVSSSLELGVVVGQDAFHETPGDDVDVARISDYGGVVGYTYGYVGPYLRWNIGSAMLQPFLQTSAAFSDSAPVVEAAFGARYQVFRNVNVYAAPAVLLHMQSDVSSKFGIHYGVQVAF
ncbi:hypothetical protein KQI65_11750 [bacterium]|nr:hypothetical protein [bacterium]